MIEMKEEDRKFIRLISKYILENINEIDRIEAYEYGKRLEIIYKIDRKKDLILL